MSFTIKNTGKTASDEVAQVYLGAPKSAPEGAQFAVRALAGFERVHIAAGQSKNVTVHLPLRRLQYWSTKSNGWVTATATRAVYVAASSRDIRLQTDAVIR